MSSFLDDFRPDLGDLLYGMARARGHYLESFEQRNPNYLADHHLITMVDEYNTLFYDVGTSPGKGKFSAHEIVQYFISFRKTLKADHPYSKESIDEYWQRITGHPRFNPVDSELKPPKQEGFSSASKIPVDFGGDGTKTWESEGYDLAALNMSFRAIRRACKFGVGFIADGLTASCPNAKIRFCLDRIRMDSAFDKNVKVSGNLGNENHPITYSELRYTYRNWNKFKNNIVFYMNYNSVPAPWEQDWSLDDCFGDIQYARMTKWEKYGTHVKQKHQADGKYDEQSDETVLDQVT